MKRIFSLLLALPLLLSACSNDDSEATIATISFERQAQLLPDGSADINLQVTGLDATSTQEYIINLQFSGTATADDYELSSDHFVVGGSNPVTSIKITTKNFGTASKNLIITLVPPKGFMLGTNASTTITLGAQEQIIYDFLSASMELKQTVSPQIELWTMAMQWYDVTEELHIPVVVNAEKSTAVLGEHFEFVGEPEFVFKPGDEDASVTLKCLKVEAGKDKIVLEVDPEAKQYAQGDPGQCTITIIGSDYNKIDGTWYVDQQPTDKAYFVSWYGLTDADLVGFPEATSADTFTFDTQNNVLTTSLQSDLKNFFGTTCNMTMAGEYTVGPYDMGIIPYSIEMVDLDNCNRDFSATSTSADKNAYIGIRLMEDGGEEMLELYLIDYVSKSFFPDFGSYGMYNEERPCASGSGLYLLFYLKKAK